MIPVVRRRVSSIEDIKKAARGACAVAGLRVPDRVVDMADSVDSQLLALLLHISSGGASPEVYDFVIIYLGTIEVMQADGAFAIDPEHSIMYVCNP